MSKLKNRGRAAIITGTLMAGGHGLEASAQTQDSIPENDKDKRELVSNKTNDELVIDISILDRISKEYQKFKNSKEGKQIINFYGQQKVVEKNGDKIMQEKKAILENSNPLEYGDSIVKGKINEIVNKISKDIKRNPDKYGTFKTDGTFQIDEKLLQENIQKETEKEFKDYIKKALPRKATFFENYKAPLIMCGGSRLLISLITLIVGLINGNLIRNLKYR